MAPSRSQIWKSYELNSLALISAEKALAQEIGWEKALSKVLSSWKRLATEGLTSSHVFLDYKNKESKD